MQVLHRLPDDLRRLVLEHWAASVLQVNCLRWHRLRHTRRKKWQILRSRFPRNVHAELVRYSRVRHEWYREPESWLLDQDDEVLRILLEEVRSGLWGAQVDMGK